MKTSSPFHGRGLSAYHSGFNHPARIGLVVLITSSELLFAAPRESASRANAPVVSETIQLPPGRIGVIASDERAAWSYDQPNGQIESFGAAALDAGVNTLNSPGDAGSLNAVGTLGYGFGSVATAIAAPFVAVGSGFDESRKRLPASKLTEVETGLSGAFARMAPTELLAAAILAEAAREPGGKERWMSLSPAQARGDPETATLVLARVASLRLERQSRSDTSFFLTIETRILILRTADQSLLSDTSFTYRTPPALFLDWALNEGEPFEKCVRSGYREIARNFFADLNRRTGSVPLALARAKTINHRPAKALQATVSSTPHAVPPISPVQLATMPLRAGGPIFVAPARLNDYFAISHSVAETVSVDQAVAIGAARVDQAFEEVVDYPNWAVQIAGTAFLIPLGLYHQTLGPAWHALTARNPGPVDVSATNPIRQLHPAQVVAVNLTRQLQHRNLPLVALADDSNEDLLSMTPANAARVLPASFRTTANPPDTRLVQIEIERAILKATNSRRSQFAVQIKAQFRLYDVATGSVVHHGSAHYLGDSTTYEKWIKDDASRFRTELATATEQLSRTIADDLINRGWLTPAPRPPTLAGGAN